MNNYLPKDLVNIIDEHVENKKFDKVIYELEEIVVNYIQNVFMMDFEDYCAEYEKGPVHQNSGCELCNCFKDIKTTDYDCYERHIDCLNKIVNDEGEVSKMFQLTTPINKM